MRGVISAIARDGSYGQIAAEDGERYSYWTSQVRNGPVEVNDPVNFRLQEGQPVDIFNLAAALAAEMPGTAPVPFAAPRQAMAAQPARGRPVAGAQSRLAPAGQTQAWAAQFDAQAAQAGIPSDRNYWVKLFTSPSGRISRRQFWLHGVLPIIVANILLAWIPIIGQIISLLLLWASICIAFKRFHDLGYPGWWSLVYLLPAFAAAIMLGVGFYMTSLLGMAWLVAEILWGVSLLILLAQLIFIYVRIGQEGPNQYGPDPLAAA